jgi:hypothetical protein
MKAMSLVTILALLLALAVNLMSGKLSNEEQIRQTIEQIAEGAQNGDIVACMEPFSINYEDPEGLEKKTIQGILWQHFRKRGPISVWLGPIDVEIDDSNATATFDVGLVEGDANSMVPWPMSADALSFQIDLTQQEDEWRITSHTRHAIANPR